MDKTYNFISLYEGNIDVYVRAGMIMLNDNTLPKIRKKNLFMVMLWMLWKYLANVHIKIKVENLEHGLWFFMKVIKIGGKI